ncbi:MAG: sigma-70 family RNA polymerase sigma factor [Phaeodactylibacter sp.]|uniref:RNA polymerase sigma factor n=1 Tax=Phaeodactylibacter sp. TaxID=1940289 RepID=UPI0032EF18F7
MENICNKEMKDLSVIHSYLETQATACFKVLYDRYVGKIFAKCISILKDEVAAQDATQEIFTKIFLNLSRFKEKARFSTWVYSITYNYCIDYLRRKKKQKDLFSDDIEQVPDLAEEEVSDKIILEIELDQLEQVLQHISDSDRMVLLMKYQDRMSIKEIAEIIDKTESAVKMKIKRAKAKAQQTREALFPQPMV